ncbi:MAG: DegT/DnrJ/EryC1/StrS family aminotransferase [Spirosomataceae bacterium]
MEELALVGGPKVIKDDMPHFIWPIITKRTEQAVIAQLHESISIYDRSGVIRNFEDRFREYHGLKHALLNNSGTSSIYAMYKGIEIGPNDEVICPVYTFFATVTPLLFTGATPVFCDCLDNGNIDPALIEKKINVRTKAIVVTHMWGNPCQMDVIQKIAKKHHLYLLEDCSHAHGAKYNGKLVGTFGDAAVWSLQGQKILTGGEGGILATNNEDIYAIAQLVGHYNKRSLREIPVSHRFYKFGVTGFGQKFRSHPLAVAIANEQFDHLDEWIEQKSRYAVKISEALKEYNFLKMPKYEGQMPSWYGFIIRYDSEKAGGLPLSCFVEALHAEGLHEVDIPKSTAPLNLYPIFREPAVLFPEFYDHQTDFIQNTSFKVAHDFYN